jgi:flagella basal body P-ring formation protein FlgA
MTNRHCLIAALVGLMGTSSETMAAAPVTTQDLAQVRAAVEAAVAPRLTARDANVEIDVGSIDPRLQFPACPSLDVTLPPTTTAAMTAKVSCDLPRWSFYVPVRVHAWVEAMVAAANLPANRTLGPSDLTRGKVDIFASSGGVITDEKDAAGKILRAGLFVGAPVLSSMLEMPIAVRRGQRVILTASDQTIVVKTAAIAMEDGRVGDNIPVQNPDSQKTVNATVTRDGGVEIKF